MEVRKSSGRAAARPEARMSSLKPTPTRPESSGAARCHSTAVPEAGEFFALKECQILLKQRLSKPLLKLFQELTGLRVHVLWQTPLDLLRPDNRLLVCPAAHHRRDGGNDMCRLCQQRLWWVDTQATSIVRRFRGECGLTNFRAAVELGANCPLQLVLQAHVMEANPRPRPKRQYPPTVAPIAFNHAAAMLGVIHHDLQAMVNDETARVEVGRSRRRLQNLECELARLRLELHQRIPVLPDAAGPAPGSPARQHLQAILDYLHQHYDRPLSLKELAATFKLNPDYLAHLFAQTMGLRFHDYLQELRLAKARELLLDPR